MKIGIDALYLRPGKVGGTESYLRNLLKGFSLINDDNEWYIFTAKNNHNTFQLKNNHFHFLKCNVNNSNRLKRLYYQNMKLPKKIKKLDLDLMFFPTYTRCLNKLKNTKVVSNLHDLQYKHFPDYFSILKKIIFNIFYPVSIKKSDFLISISNFVKNDIVRYFGKKYNNKIKTIYNPIDFEKLKMEVSKNELKKLNIKSKRYILSVSSLLPHKNISTLIKAFKDFIERQQTEYKLVLVGVKDKSTNSIIELINDLNIKDKIIIPGFVSNNTLAALYQNALLYISTSRFEGFGMTPIEAMYNEIPVITTKEASLPEVTMDNAFYYEPSKDFVALSKEISEVINNYPSKETLEAISMEVYQKYNLQKIAKEYIKFFKEVVNK